MTSSRNPSQRASFCRAAVFLRWTLAAVLVALMTAGTVAARTLEVDATSGLPGFHRGELQRYLALRMTEAGLGEWHFEPAAGGGTASDRVEWTFKLNPYAGGEVRNFMHRLIDERGVGVHRRITIEVRLYLNGEYQTLVERQAVLQGGPNDPDLAAAVASATQSLLGPSGAYRGIDAGGRAASRPR